ncbi:N-6 DNA methylase [Desulfosudis oleivorans]|uniref:site-specific DNA-methyltransferase (adenine-specific) n=1 Tax=Desulfosudis oleivorans (strain DSM 6200 / JCM 39069 / Hxd3) TaxID=96561 RepID=A8ZY60_DESOH|nr:N-6 DNA methylase [Desulfosudis oleivorans]ABW67067.1 N-6 DNA methylase [Desulfosudis oleivorans Hxd3]
MTTPDQKEINDRLKNFLKADMKLAIATLLYLRWADFQEAELEAMAAFEGTEYEPVLPASLHWRTWHQLSPEDLSNVLTRQLPVALDQLKNFRHNPMATHLHRLAAPTRKLGDLPPKILANTVSRLAEKPFETPADHRRALKDIDGRFGEAKDGYHTTPLYLTKFMVELAAPSKGESIYDPCFGTADLLITTIDHVSGQQENTGYNMESVNISGVEKNISAYIVGMTRLVLAGASDPKIELGNSLERTAPANPQQDGFDVVLATPPWGAIHKILKEEIELNGKYYPVRTRGRAGLFIQHALANLRPDGRAIIAVPQSLLFGDTEINLRAWLIENHTVEAVISLPPNVFGALISIPSGILVLRRGGSTKQIRMVNAEPFFEQGRGKQPTTISDSQIHSLVAMIRNPEQSQYCWDVEVESLAELGFDLTPRRRDRSSLLGVLDELNKLRSIPIEPLKECCEILHGCSIRSHDLKDTSPVSQELAALSLGAIKEESMGEKQPGSLSLTIEPVPYIRIKDIEKGQVTKGTSWISEKAIELVKASWKLRAGDVLISKSGTIGKVGIVCNGAVGAVAASGLYVLRPKDGRIDPHFLVAYLDSNECRAWLKDRASGGVINHLNKRAIENLPVPIPPLQIQHRVADEFREHKVDALNYLMVILSGKGHDSIAEWIEKTIKKLPSDMENKRFPLDLSLLDQLAKEAQAFADERNSDDNNNDLLPWLLAFSHSLRPLQGINSLPQGPGMLIALKESKQRIVGITNIKGDKPAKTLRKVIGAAVGIGAAAGTTFAAGPLGGILATPFLLKGLTAKTKKNISELPDIVSKLIDLGMSTLLDDIKLVFTGEVSFTQPGELQEIDLTVQNQSPLPLREVAIYVDTANEGKRVEYLAENTTETLTFKLTTPPAPGTYMRMVQWSAVTLDGLQLNGEQEIAFEFSADGDPDEASPTELGGSPYVCGDPIGPESNEVFFGREKLLEQIRRQVVKSGNVVLLEGNRRAGKSSVLCHLEGNGPVPGWLGVYCSLQGAEGSKEGVGVPTASVFRTIAINIAKGLATLDVEVPLPDGSLLPMGEKRGIAKACRKGIGEESPFEDFCEYAEVALDLAAQNKLGILLMLDEFDKLQEGIDNGITSPQVPENIRYMVQTYSGFSAILTGSRRLKKLREEYWSALYGLGTLFNVSSLSHGAASRLVTEPVKGRLTYTRESVEKAIFLTNGQPFLLQCLCNRVFDMVAQLKIRAIRLDIVEQAADRLAENNEHFASLWDYAQSDRRRFILGLINKQMKESGLITLALLIELLANDGINVTDDELIEDIEFLRELELIDLTGGADSGEYTLSIPLMGRWIDRQHDFAMLRNKAQRETEDHAQGETEDNDD